MASYIQYSNSSSGSDAGNLTLTEPTGTAQGDLIVAQISWRGSNAITTPSGWTQIFQDNGGNTANDSTGKTSSGVWYITRGASAPSYSFAKTAASGSAVGHVANVQTHRPDSGKAIIFDSSSVNALTVGDSTPQTSSNYTYKYRGVITFLTVFSSSFESLSPQNPTPANGGLTFGTYGQGYNQSVGGVVRLLTNIAVASSVTNADFNTGIITWTTAANAASIFTVAAFGFTEYEIGRHWVGGTASWDSTAGTKWSATPGGAGGASVPTSTTDVYFSANSGASTVTIGTTPPTCKNLDTTGFSGDLNYSSGSQQLHIYGSMLIGPTTTISSSGTGGTYFKATTPQNITTNGVTQPNWVFDTQTTWTIVDSITFKSGKNMIVQGGTYANCKVIGLAGSKKNITFAGNVPTTTGFLMLGYGGSSSGYIENFNLIFNNVNYVASSSGLLNSMENTNTSISNCSIQIAGLSGIDNYTHDLTYISKNNLILDSLSITGTISGSSYFNVCGNNPSNITNLTIAPSSGKIVFGSVGIVTGSVTITGVNRTTQRAYWMERYGSAPTASTHSLTNVSFQGVRPTVAWSGTSLENMCYNNNITFTTSVARTASVSGVWTNESTWGGNSMPLAQDTVHINTGITVNPDRIIQTTNSLFGACSDLTQATSSSITPSGAPGSAGLYLVGRSARTLSGNNYTQSLNLLFPDLLATATTGSYTISVFGDIYSLFFGSSFMNYDGGDATSATQTLTVTVTADPGVNLGTVLLGASGHTRYEVNLPNCKVGKLYNYNSTGTYNSNIDSQDVNEVTGIGDIIRSEGSRGTILLPTNCVLSGTGNKTIINNGGIGSFTNLSITGTGNMIFAGSTGVDFGSVSRTFTTPMTFTFNASNTYNVNAWNIVGSAGNLVTITSNTTGQHTLNYTGVGVLDLNYLSISYSNAIPSNTWYAGTNSTDGGNNIGWIFTGVPKPGGLFFGSNF